MSIRLKLSPELADGQHWTVVDTRADAMEAINAWFDNFEQFPMTGDCFKVDVVEMSDEEVDALPPI
ncbi:MAG: hypothetical protein ACYSYL_21600 [Planctomycetota bacterium]|jgi:hypothetical protein